MLESAYLSKRLDIPPCDLAEVAARWHQRLRHTRSSSRGVRVSRGFWLASETHDLAAEYVVRGVVWIYGRPVPVIMEFTPWSETRSEVGVSPRTLAWPVGTERYVRRVLVALDSVDQGLCSCIHDIGLQSELATARIGRPERVWRHRPAPAPSLSPR
jgi:hypothetical protein